MPCTTAVSVVRTIGIDTGKNTLHMIGLDEKGAIVLREKVSRNRIAALGQSLPDRTHSALGNLTPNAFADQARQARKVVYLAFGWPAPARCVGARLCSVAGFPAAR